MQGVIKNIDQARGIIIMNSDPELTTNSVVCLHFWLFLKTEIYYYMLLYDLPFYFEQLHDHKGMSIDQLIPGMMVNAQVHATLENGVMLSFLTYFKGTVRAI